MGHDNIMNRLCGGPVLDEGQPDIEFALVLPLDGFDFKLHG